MKLTKESLRKMISEEMDNMPKEKSPREIMRSISKLADESQMNKSFGFSKRIMKQYHDELLDLVNQLKPEEEE
jgi:hypothetical protein